MPNPCLCPPIASCKKLLNMLGRTSSAIRALRRHRDDCLVMLVLHAHVNARTFWRELACVMDEIRNDLRDANGIAVICSSTSRGRYTVSCRFAASDESMQP